MSRVGKKPLKIPSDVTVEVKDGRVEVVGPKGCLKLDVRPEIKVEIQGDSVLVKRIKDEKISRSLHGLTRTLIANMVEGVTQGFSKTLKLVGTGYRATKEGETLVLALGFSHLVKVAPPEGIKLDVEKDDIVRVVGIDKALVGQWAARLRAIRPPEPYKGKGIRYEGEQVRIKPGKAGKVGAGGVTPGGTK